MSLICRHYWLLSPPQGDVVLGRCKLCKRDRVFPARLDETDRSNDYLDLQEAGAGTGARLGGWSERLAA